MELQTIPTPEDDLFRRMLDQRRVMLTGSIDGKLAERVCAQLLVLEADDPDAAVTLYLHSPGGEVDAGFAIYDTMQALRCDVAIQAEQFSLARRLMAELTAEHTGRPVERIIADGDRDRWFTAQEALAYGMVDDVIGARQRVVTSRE